ncbi:hypothetical protein NT1RE_24690 (plasmid) [Agrobacterium fabrum]|uniref:hypothetical protein n=1 Tax=Agrobacterium fabrum TaxID=1176649 RepID=UPI0003124DAC|nr:hypothetical protein [Agrobacterium fabrum]CAD0217045.1 hypothetical protein AGTUEHA105_LOCUS4974 [Agrobacterium tumefaciens]MCX2878275.1 hypothetical protein [Agrobacterium fabrum]NMV72815.1 hypothetical protein [Agrobacterium fabrum]QQN14110.1 hypothetical protein EML540_24685 [Agrobacterium fabrum]TRB22790.1 hypothetical protein EXN51_26465 [Agrobacterium fabrum]
MSRNVYLASAARVLSLSDKEIARRLDVSVATLRSVDSVTSPAYLRFALATLVAELDPEAVLGAGVNPSFPSSDKPSISQ